MSKLIIMFFLYALCITSCEMNMDMDKKSRKIVIDKRYDAYVSQNFDKYKHIYHAIQDTLDAWVDKNLEDAISLKFNEYKLDSLLVFNESNDRVYTSLNYKNYNEARYHFIKGFRGHFIDGKWYFTKGATYDVRRSNYTDDAQYPFTFEQLSYLARTKYIGRFLKENEQGELVPDEEKFQDYFVNGFAGPDSKIEDIEQHIKKEIYYYHRDTLDQETIDRITEDVAKRKAAVLLTPPREYKKTSPPKLFDSEAWKNRHKVEKNKKSKTLIK